MPLPQFQTMPLGRRARAFRIPTGYLRSSGTAFGHYFIHGARMVSRNGNTFKSFPGLCEGLARDLEGRRCVLGGEIVCLDNDGKPQFRDLFFRRAEPRFYAFDILWDEHAWSDDEQARRRFNAPFKLTNRVTICQSAL